MNITSITATCMLAFIGPLAAQDDFFEPPDFLGGPPPGGPMAEKREILAQFDKDNDQHLNRDERAAARAFLKENPVARRFGGPPGGMRGPGGLGPMGGPTTPPVPGQKLAPTDVKPAAAADLFDAKTLRTLFLDFDNSDWEAELEAFHSTDVDVPAKLTVDGKTYSGVGIRFRGMSSYMSIRSSSTRTS